MPKFKSEPIKKEDIKRYLQESDDFQFEMDVFRLCQNNGLKAIHGGTYQDPVTNKDRQFDIRAYKILMGCVLQMAVECKNLNQNYPLLVSRIPRLRDESYHDLIVSSQSVDPGKEPRTRIRRFKQALSLFHQGELVGKSTTQIGRAFGNGELISSDNDVYEKWSQAIASSYDLVQNSSHDKLPRIIEDTKVTLVQPTLVVSDKTLWVADYSADGKLMEDPKTVEECSVYLDKIILGKYANLEYRISHLFIYSKSGFEKVLQKLNDDDSHWYRLFPEYYDP